MYCADASFLIDLLRGVPAAVQKASDFEARGQLLAIPAPCVAELVRGASIGSSRERERTEELIDTLEILPLDSRSALIAGKIAAESTNRGQEVPLLDCLIAAIAQLAEATLITRDRDFARIPGLTVETY
jgi:tRNA(fMet)-specific endonuclease VapC